MNVILRLYALLGLTGSILYAFLLGFTGNSGNPFCQELLPYTRFLCSFSRDRASVCNSKLSVILIRVLGPPKGESRGN